MEYGEMRQGIFLRRPNRFIAHVQVDGAEQICHVKNTGRCRELLPPGATVWCKFDPSEKRKTHYDLISVRKGDRIVNMDSQAPNKAAGEWLTSGGLGELDELRAEYTHGDSRFDFSFLKDGRRCFLEVKGVTLEHESSVSFPDAPTERGAKHLRGLQKAVEEGYGAYILFVIQMENVTFLRPNDETDPAFGKALRDAAKAGVQVLAMDCRVEPGTMEIFKEVEVRL